MSMYKFNYNYPGFILSAWTNLIKEPVKRPKTAMRIRLNSLKRQSFKKVATTLVFQFRYVCFALYSGIDDTESCQWTEDPHGGFTAPTVKPWLPAFDCGGEWCHAHQQKCSDSVWSFYRSMIQLRKSNPTLVSCCPWNVAFRCQTTHFGLFLHSSIMGPTNV